MDLGTAEYALEALKAWAFPLSLAAFLVGYPLSVLIWTIRLGRAAERNVMRPAMAVGPGSGNLKDTKGVRKKQQRAALTAGFSSRRSGHFTVLLVILVLAGALVFGVGRAFIGSSGGQWNGSASSLPPAEAGPIAIASPGAAAEEPQSFSGDAMPLGTPASAPSHPKASGASAALVMAATAAAAVVYVSGAMRSSQSNVTGGSSRGDRKKSKSSRSSSGTGTGSSAPETASQHAPAVDAPSASLWHQVDLRVKDWLDEATGLFRYVNEIPAGGLQKFELQTPAAGNPVREDVEASLKLQAFGRPVPFNYGCFPQTLRDPRESGNENGASASGDDEPLDVVNLDPEPVPISAVVTCRVLGAACLFDDGKADWKVIVVGADGPLGRAQSLEDVERLAPGRLTQALTWLDDYEHHSSKKHALHYEIRSADAALATIEQDHQVWRHLVGQAGPATGEGRATPKARRRIQRWHWLVPEAMQTCGEPHVLDPSFACTSGYRLHQESTHMPSVLLAGSASPCTKQHSGQSLTLRKNAGSDGSGDSGSANSSSDTDVGA